MNSLTLKVKRIKIFEIDNIQMDVKTPKTISFDGIETGNQMKLIEMLGALDWRIKGTEYPEDEQHGITPLNMINIPTSTLLRLNARKNVTD